MNAQLTVDGVYIIYVQTLEVTFVALCQLMTSNRSEYAGPGAHVVRRRLRVAMPEDVDVPAGPTLVNL